MSELAIGSYEPLAIEAARQAAWREAGAFGTPPAGDERPHL